MKEDKRFVLDSFWTLSSTIITILAGASLNIYIGNVYNAEGLGLYTVSLSIYMILSIIGPLGTHNALVKFVAQHHKNPKEINHFVSIGFIISFASGVFLSILIFFSSDLFGNFFSRVQGYSQAQKIIALSILFIALNKSILSFFNGLKLMKHYSLLESLRYIFIVIFTFIFSISLKSIYGAIWAFPVSEIFLFIIAIITCKKHFEFIITNFFKYTKQLLSFGIQVLFSGFVGQLNTKIDLLLIGYFLADTDAGIYAVSVMLARSVLLLPGAIQKITNPSITRYYYEKNQKQMEKMINILMKFVFIAFILGALLLILLYKPIINFIYPNNPEFLTSYEAFKYLMIGIIFFGTFATVGTSIGGSIGRPDIAWKISVSLLFLNGVLNIALIPKLGILGAALATMISLIINFILALFLQKKLLKIKIHVSYFLRGLLIILLHQYLILNLPTEIPIIITCIVCIICTIVVMYILKMLEFSEIKLFIKSLKS